MTKQPKKNRIDLSLGLEPFEIYFEGIEEPVTIRFNPADDDLPKRLFEAQKRIEDSTKNIPRLSAKSADEIDPEEYTKMMNSINEEIYKAVDYAFAAPISKEVFSHCSPLSPVDKGVPFILHFFEQLLPHLERIIQTKSTASDRYVREKYGKYIKQ